MGSLVRLIPPEKPIPRLRLCEGIEIEEEFMLAVIITGLPYIMEARKVDTEDYGGIISLWATLKMPNALIVTKIKGNPSRSLFVPELWYKSLFSLLRSIKMLI